MKLIEMKNIVKELLVENNLNCKVSVKTVNMKVEFPKNITDEELEEMYDIVEIDTREAIVKTYNIKIEGDFRHENMNYIYKVDELLEEVKKEIKLHFYIING